MRYPKLSEENKDPTRRDFLTLTAGAMGAVGVGAVARALDGDAVIRGIQRREQHAIDVDVGLCGATIHKQPCAEGSDGNRGLVAVAHLAHVKNFLYSGHF